MTAEILKPIQLIFWVCSFTLIFPFAHNRYDGIQALCFVIAGIVSTVLMLKDKSFEIRISKDAIVLSSLAFIAVSISSFQINEPFRAIIFLSLVISGFMQFLYFSKADVRIKKISKKLIIFASCIQTFIVLIQSFHWNPLYLQNKMHVLGTLGNPDFVAIFLGISLFYVFLNSNKTKLMVVYYLFIAIGIVLCRSKGVILFGSVTLLLCILPRKKGKLVIPVAIGLMTVVFFFLHADPLKTLEGRGLIWNVSWSIFKENLFGIGADQFINHYFDHQYKVLQTGIPDWMISRVGFTHRAHNEFFDSLVEFGIFGFLFFLGLCLHLWKRLDSKNIFLLIFVLLISMTSFPFHQTPSLALICAVLAFGIKQPVGHYQISKRFLLASFLILLPGLVLNSINLRTEYYLNRALVQRSQGEKKDSSRSLKEALFLNPNHYYANLELARSSVKTEPDESLKYIDKIQKIGEQVDDNKLMAFVLFERREWDKSLEVYEKLNMIFPDHITPYYMKAKIFKITGREGEAIEQLQMALTKHPTTTKGFFESLEARKLLVLLSKKSSL